MRGGDFSSWCAGAASLVVFLLIAVGAAALARAAFRRLLNEAFGRQMRHQFPDEAER